MMMTCSSIHCLVLALSVLTHFGVYNEVEQSRNCSVRNSGNGAFCCWDCQQQQFSVTHSTGAILTNEKKKALGFVVVFAKRKHFVMCSCRLHPRQWSTLWMAVALSLSVARSGICLTCLGCFHTNHWFRLFSP